MSNNQRGVTKGVGQGRVMVPKLRFPEFRDGGEWIATPLGETCEPISEKVGNAKLIPVSISAGRGFVSQASKFGRDISGAQYQKYTYLRKGDFAYNKGNSIPFPQGYICQLKEFEEAAASSAFICFRLKPEYSPSYFQALFDQNIHGRQLARFITSGARSNGLLNIRTEDFYGVRIPLPPKLAEQHRIADCLSSLDALIAAERDRLAALKVHKKGLMQHLFPAHDQTTPQLRFPEFQGSGEWEVKRIGDACHLYQPETLSTADLDPNGQFPVYGANGIIGRLDRYNHADSEVAVTCRGATCGEVLKTLPMSWINGNAMVVRPKNEDLSKAFLFQFLKNDGLQSVVSGSAQPQITRAGFSPFHIKYPKEGEQQRIVDCLSTADKLIAECVSKFHALKRHKSGLVQQLFPSLHEASA